MDIKEADLIEAAQKGHEAAIEKLYVRYHEAIANLAFCYVGNYQDAEELLQDIFVKSFLAIHRYRPMPNASFFSWIYRIGINCAINFLKKKKVRQFQSGSEIREYNVQSHRLLEPEARYVNMEIRKVFYEALDALSPKQRMIVILKYSNQMSTAEVAAQLKCSEGTVRKQLYRAVVKLRRDMAWYRRRKE